LEAEAAAEARVAATGSRVRIAVPEPKIRVVAEVTEQDVRYAAIRQAELEEMQAMTEAIQDEGPRRYQQTIMVTNTREGPIVPGAGDTDMTTREIQAATSEARNIGKDVVISNPWPGVHAEGTTIFAR
jgi:hypothetical protein